MLDDALMTIRSQYNPRAVKLVGELLDPPRGPIAAVVEYLGEHATLGDVLVTTYGELPLKFHTDLVVYGGETAQFPPSGDRPEWVWPRHLTTDWDAVMDAKAWLEAQSYLADYQRIELPVSDRRWENREDPVDHVFSNPGPSGPPVVLLKRPS